MTVPLSFFLPLVTVSLTGHFSLTVGVWLAMCGVILKLAASAVAGQREGHEQGQRDGA